MEDSNYQQVLRKYAARVDDYQNIFTKGPLSQSNSPSHKAKAYYNWLPSATLTRENAEEIIKHAQPYWLHPKLTRSQVTSLLFDKPQGSFLVRESSTANCYALSVRLPTDELPVKHYLIECITNGYAIQGSGLPFPTIPKLLAYFCFSTSGGMPCFLRPPILPDAEASTDYTPMTDVSGQEQSNFQVSPVMGWTSPSSTMEAYSTAKPGVKQVSSSPKKPNRPYLEPLEIASSAPPELPPRADIRLREGANSRRKPRSILLQKQNTDDKNSLISVAVPYAVVPIAQIPDRKTGSSVSKSDSSLPCTIKRQKQHIYDEIVFNSTETEVVQKEEMVPSQVSKPKVEESPYAEPNNEDNDDTEVPNHVISPPPLPPRAPSMTPPHSPRTLSCSPASYSDDNEYIEPDVIEDIVKHARSLSVPSNQFMTVAESRDSKLTTSINQPSSTVAKEKKSKLHKRGSTLSSLLRTFKKRSPTSTNRIIPDNLPSEEVSWYQNSVDKYNLDLPCVAEDAGSELLRRLSSKSRHKQDGTLSRHRSLSPLDSYVDMHSERRPLSSSSIYYEPMKLRQEFQTDNEYQVPCSLSPSSTPDNEISDAHNLRKSKSESSLLDDLCKPHPPDATLESQLSHSTECVVCNNAPERCDIASPAKSASPSDDTDDDIAVKAELKQPLRPQKPAVGPKPQIKPKPSLPPKPSIPQRPPVMPRAKTQQQTMPKLPPKPSFSTTRSASAVCNGVVHKTKADIRIPEVVGDSDCKVRKSIGRPPPPPPKIMKSSYVMVKKPPAAKGPYAVPSVFSKDLVTVNKSLSSVSPNTEAKNKDVVGLVVELKESDDDELEQIEFTVDSGANTTDSVLITSTEVDGTVGVQGSNDKKRKKTKKLKKNWSPFTFLHKKSHEQRVKEYIFQLSMNRNTSFGSSLSQFISVTRREVPNLSYQQLLSNVRNFIDSSREKLQTEYSKELVEHGMKGCRNFDVLLEKILQDTIVQPLQQCIQFKIEKHFSDTGSLQQFQRNITAAKQLLPADLGIRDHLIPPGEQAIEEARKLFNEMEQVHSAFHKIELLLQAVRITYDNVHDVANKNKSSRRLGADDFLPLFIYVLIHADFCKAEVEAEYMWGLVHPSLLNGEGGYYLTTLTSAVNVLKETQFGSEHHQDTKDIPGMDDSQAFLCVWIKELYGCAVEPPISKTLPVHASMTVADTCALISNTMDINNPEAYGLYAITSSSETLLEKHHFPQRIKHDLLAKHQSGQFVYKTV